MTPGLGLFIIGLLVLVNGFFVATEFALVAVRRSRLEELASKGNLRAKAAIEVVTHLDIYIAACQLGITMASLALGWVGEPALANLIQPPIERLAGSYAPAVAHSIAVVVAFTFITALHIVAGELAPKGMALQKTEETVLWVTGPIRLFYLVFRWPTKLLNSVGNGLLKLLGMKPASGAEMVHTVSELEVLLKGMQKEGVVGDKEVDYVTRVFLLARRAVREVMTPRTAVVCLDKGMTIARFLEFNARQTFSHFPICDSGLDSVTGMLAVKDMLRALGDEKVTENDPIGRVAQPVQFVPETKGILDLMEEMRREGHSIALVVDEFGGVSGLITFKQLVGEIVGKIGQEGTEELVQQLKDGTIQASGALRIHEANARLSAGLPENEEYDTIAGFLMSRLGRLPQQGDCVSHNGMRLEVVEMRGRRIARVNLVRSNKA